jgi:hypothetical protein
MSNNLLQPPGQQKTLSGHVSSPTQHGHDIRALLRASAPTHRDVLHISRSTLQLLLGLDHSSSSDHGWGDIIESNATLAHLARKILGQALDTGLGDMLVPGR